VLVDGVEVGGEDPGQLGRTAVEISVVVALTVAWVVLGSLLGAGFSDLLPLAVAVVLLVHLAVRRRTLRTAFGRDSASFASRWPGKVLVAAVLLAIPAAMVSLSFSAGRYADDSWTALLVLIVLAGGYTASRRWHAWTTHAASACWPVCVTSPSPGSTSTLHSRSPSPVSAPT
jgi:hypothetical protein